MQPLDDDDINAYLYDRLDAEQAFAIAAHLTWHPREAARVASYRAGTEALRMVLNPVMQQPAPEPMRALLRRHGGSAARRRKVFVSASIALSLALVGLGGRALQQHLGPLAAVLSAPAPPAITPSDAARFIRI
ncbi:MAG TPA: hypothetical protein VLV50_16800 [Stellaceae bacterium]|nr:hypothetical protein [Stellaceae bacterium]